MNGMGKNKARWGKGVLGWRFAILHSVFRGVLIEKEDI